MKLIDTGRVNYESYTAPVLQEHQIPAGKKSIYCAQLSQNGTEQERTTHFDCGVFRRHHEVESGQHKLS